MQNQNVENDSAIKSMIFSLNYLINWYSLICTLQMQIADSWKVPPKDE